MKTSAFSRLVLLLYSIRYTRLRQLLARLHLLCKRKLIPRIASAHHKASVALASAEEVWLADQLPSAVFAPRKQFVSADAPLALVFLNETRTFSHGIEWKPDDLKIGTRLWLLNLHYMEFIEALDTHRQIAIMDDWIDKNLPYDVDYWLDNWNCFSLSIRVVVWMQCLAKVDHANFTDQLEKIHRSVVAQLRFLARNLELDIGGNHLLKNIKALLWGARYFRGGEAATWKALAERLLQKELSEQILDDGMHYELSPAYHCQVFADLLECYCVLDSGVLQQRLGLLLQKMAQVVRDLTHSDGLISLFGDGGLHMAYLPAECLAAYRELFHSLPERRRFVLLHEAGYFGLNGDEETLLVDCGSLAPDYLPAHGHGDALAFEWTVGDKRIVIDPGVLTYNSGEWRQYSRATSSHNTVTVDDQDQSEFWSSFRVGRRARIVRRQISQRANTLNISASHDGYARLPGRPIHSRTFTLSSGGVDIVDTITGGTGQAVCSRIMLHPECVCDAGDPRNIVVSRGEVTIVVSSERPVTLHESFCFMDFGTRTLTTTLCIDMGPAPCANIVRLRRISHL